MSDLDKQGERFIVLETAEGRGAFLVNLAQSFGSERAAVEAAKRMTVPGGAKLVVLGMRFCATVVPPNKLPDRGRGSPMLPSRNVIVTSQRPRRRLTATEVLQLEREIDDILEGGE